MLIKGIFFDYDGTISDRTRSSYANYRLLLHLFFPEMDMNSAEFESCIQDCILRDEYGTIAKRTVMEYIRDRWKPDLDVQEALQLWYRYFPDHQYWTEGMQETLQILHQSYRIGLVTNGPHDRQWPKIRQMHLEDIFEAIVVSEDAGCRKPDPRIYEIAAQRLHLQCSECAYVGDTFSTDIVGALNAGMFPVWYCGEHVGISEMHICRITRAQELLELFPQREKDS